MRHSNHWTVAEANRALPYVGRQVDRLRELCERMQQPEAEQAYATAAIETGGGWPGREAATPAVETALILHRLDRLDIVVRDLERGLVDFPSLRDGDEVYLCWLRDAETSVGHWHDPAAGFAGRRPL